VQLIVDGLRIADAFVDEGLGEAMSDHQDVLEDLD
jgi:hypothetical protein